MKIVPLDAPLGTRIEGICWQDATKPAVAAALNKALGEHLLVVVPGEPMTAPLMRDFAENNDGVHLMNGEFSLCGDSFDIGSTEGEECGDLMPTKARTVTCVECIAIIKLCRGVRTHAN